jgi:hypothetical protein
MKVAEPDVQIDTALQIASMSLIMNIIPESPPHITMNSIQSVRPIQGKLLYEATLSWKDRRVLSIRIICILAMTRARCVEQVIVVITKVKRRAVSSNQPCRVFAGRRLYKK